MKTRTYFWLAAGIAVFLILGVLLLAIEGQRAATALNARIQVIQLRQSQLADLLDHVTTVETAERGFLLTSDPKYLTPYAQSRDAIEPILDSLTESFRLDQDRAAGDQRAHMQQLRTLIGEEITRLSAMLSLYAKSGGTGGLALVRTDVNLDEINRIRAIVTDIDNREHSSVAALLAQLDRNSTSSFLLLVGVTALNVLLIFGAGLLLDRDLQRKGRTAVTMEQHAEELERQVQARTAELSTLSSHLQHLAETEKAALARELHDELGGVLVAAKMDVSWVEKHVASPGDPAIQLRWKRIRDALDQGVDIKRRIVESLRPTLLDTLGLVPALKWVFQETCGRSGIRCTERYPEPELHLSEDASIKIFRLVQEALTNIVKHARATEASLEIAVVGDDLVIRVVDNGVGIPTVRSAQGGFHGLASMRHRVASLGGRWELNSPPGGGTEVLVRLPIARIVDPVSGAAA
jgi:signal transduction histidine kinase